MMLKKIHAVNHNNIIIPTQEMGQIRYNVVNMGRKFHDFTIVLGLKSHDCIRFANDITGYKKSALWVWTGNTPILTIEVSPVSCAPDACRWSSVRMRVLGHREPRCYERSVGFGDCGIRGDTIAFSGGSDSTQTCFVKAKTFSRLFCSTKSVLCI